MCYIFLLSLLFWFSWWTASIKPRLPFSHAGYASWGLSFSSFYFNLCMCGAFVRVIVWSYKQTSLGSNFNYTYIMMYCNSNNTAEFLAIINKKNSFFLNACCVMVFYVFCVVLSVGFCTGHFIMVSLNLTYLHCLPHSFFEHLFNLYYSKGT